MTVSTSPKLHVRLLGPVELRLSGGTTAPFPGGKLKILLACLVLAEGRPWPRSSLTKLLWGNRASEQARASLRQALAKLRLALGDPALILARDDAIALDVGMITTDALEFRRLCAAGRFEDARTHYGGDLLEGVAVGDPAASSWLSSERESLRAMLATCLSRIQASTVAIPSFSDLGPDAGRAKLGERVTIEIVTALSHFPTTQVVSDMRSSARYLIRGSVERAERQIRVNAQLVANSTAACLWASSFTCDLKRDDAMPDEFTRSIATTLAYRIESAERARSLRKRVDDLSALELVQRAEALILRMQKEVNVEARTLAERAIALEPNDSLPHAQVGWTHILDYCANWVADRNYALKRAFEFAHRAVLLDESDSRARWLLGNVHLYRREYDSARDHLEFALELNPNDVEARAIYGLYLTSTGDPSAALAQFDLSKRLNTFEYNWIGWYRGIALFTAARYEEAISAFRRVHNPTPEVRCWLSASLAAAGRIFDARAALKEFLTASESEMAVFPGTHVSDWIPYLHGFIEYRDAAQLDRLVSALRRAGLT